MDRTFHAVIGSSADKLFAENRGEREHVASFVDQADCDLCLFGRHVGKGAQYATDHGRLFIDQNALCIVERADVTAVTTF